MRGISSTSFSYNAFWTTFYGVSNVPGAEAGSLIDGSTVIGGDDNFDSILIRFIELSGDYRVARGVTTREEADHRVTTGSTISSQPVDSFLSIQSAIIDAETALPILSDPPRCIAINS